MKKNKLVIGVSSKKDQKLFDDYNYTHSLDIKKNEINVTKKSLCHHIQHDFNKPLPKIKERFDTIIFDRYTEDKCTKTIVKKLYNHLKKNGKLYVTASLFNNRYGISTLGWKKSIESITIPIDIIKNSTLREIAKNSLKNKLKKDFNKQHRIDKLHYNEMMSKYKQNKSEFLKDKTQIIKLFLENTYNQYRPEFFIKYIINEKLINRLNTKNINNERKIITMIENRSKQSTKFQKDFQRGVDLIVQYILFHKIFIFFKDKSVTPADKRKIIYILIDHITKNINKLRTMPMSIWSQYLLSKKDTSTFKKLNNLLKKNVILENNLNPDKNINYFMFIDEFIKKTELPKLKKKIIHNAINNISKILSKELKNSTISISKKHPIKEIRANNRNLDTESREIDGYVYEYCLIIKKK